MIRDSNHAPSTPTWDEAIKLGTDQLDRGEGITYTPDLLQSITASALSAMHSDTVLDPAVMP